MRVQILLAVLLAAAPAHGEGGSKHIEDNSFLVEEAYNQESGVVQHIQSWQYLKKAKTWSYAFTQEWPVPGRRHQLSYTVPAAMLRDAGGVGTTGLTDAAVNYRCQLVDSEQVAMAPRLSVLLPTGDFNKGLGSGAPGYQFNLPLSARLAPDWVAHWNIGATQTPLARGPGGVRADTLGFNYGTSVIWQPLQKLNLMLEAVWNSTEAVDAAGGKSRADSFFLSPGLRGAIDVGSLQIVPGVAVPIGMGPSRREHGILAYLSFEHPLF